MPNFISEIVNYFCKNYLKQLHLCICSLSGNQCWKKVWLRLQSKKNGSSSGTGRIRTPVSKYFQPVPVKIKYESAKPMEFIRADLVRGGRLTPPPLLSVAAHLPLPLCLAPSLLLALPLLAPLLLLSSLQKTWPEIKVKQMTNLTENSWRGSR